MFVASRKSTFVVGIVWLAFHDNSVFALSVSGDMANPAFETYLANAP